MTDAIKRKLQEEINALEHELIHELPKEIKKAAALGDLSENAEYHMAKQRQEFVKARVRQLGKRLADLSMVNMNNKGHEGPRRENRERSALCSVACPERSRRVSFVIKLGLSQ